MYERITGENRSGRWPTRRRTRTGTNYSACINELNHHLSTTPSSRRPRPDASASASRRATSGSATTRSSTRSTPGSGRSVWSHPEGARSSRRPPRVLAQDGERIRAALASDGLERCSGRVAPPFRPRVVLGDDVVEFAMWRESRPVDAVDAPSSMPYQTVAVRHECDAVLWYRLRKHALGTVDAVVRVAPAAPTLTGN